MRKAIIYVLVFGMACMGLGVFIGLGIDRVYVRRHFPRAAKSYLRGQISPEGQQARIKLIAGRLQRELSLSDQQVSEVRDILEKARSEINPAWETFRMVLLSSKEKVITEILSVLDPAQKEKFKKLTAAQKKKE